MKSIKLSDIQSYSQSSQLDDIDFADLLGGGATKASSQPSSVPDVFSLEAITAFNLGSPIPTQQSVRSTVRFAMDLDHESEQEDDEKLLQDPLALSTKSRSAKGKTKNSKSKYLGEAPLDRTLDLPDYTSSPELVYSQRSVIGAEATSFLPAMPTYLRFPQCEVPVQVLQRSMVREIWRRAAETGDLACAAHALFALAEMESIEMEELVPFCEMVLASPFAKALVPYLCRIVFLQAPARMDIAQRQELLFVLLQLLCKVGDLNAAKELVKHDWITAAHGASPTLLACSFAVQCLVVVETVHQLHSLLNDDKPFPVDIVDDLQRHPLGMAWPVLFLRNAIGSGKVEDQRVVREASMQLKLLEQNVSTIADIQALFRLPEAQKLIVAVWMGSNHRGKAKEHVRRLLQWAGTEEEEAVEETMVNGEDGDEEERIAMEDNAKTRKQKEERWFDACALYQAVSDVVLLFSPSTLHPGTLSVLLHLQAQRHLLYRRHSTPSLLSSWLLYELQATSKEQFVQDLADLAESSRGWEAWLAWRLLSSYLRRVATLTDHDPVHPDSGILDYIPEAAVLGGRAVGTPGSVKEEGAPSHRGEPLPASFLIPGSSQRDECVELLRSSRQWWMDSVLSVAALGDLEAVMLPFQLDSWMAALDSSLSLAPPKLPRSHGLSLATHCMRVHDEHLREALGAALHAGLEVEDTDFSDLLRSHPTATWISGDDEREVELVLHLASSSGQLLRDAYEQATQATDLSSAFEAKLSPLPSPWEDLGLASEPASELDNGEALVPLLGESRLELLASQALVAAHLTTPDHLFVLRVVQILLSHLRLPSASDSVRSCALCCLNWLRANGLNLHRCLRLGLDCTYRGIDVRVAPPPVVLLPGAAVL